jgi:hypothetical protein
MQEITIKGIPTQEIATRLMNVATALIDAYTENEARKLTVEKEAEVLEAKDCFRLANRLKPLIERAEVVAEPVIEVPVVEEPKVEEPTEPVIEEPVEEVKEPIVEPKEL